MQIIIFIDWSQVSFSRKTKISPKHSSQKRENKQNEKHILLQKKLFLPITVFMILCVIIGGTYTYITTNEDSAANFTDDIVRPILGNQKTIALEAVFFNLDDKINQIKYNFMQSGQSDKAFAESATPTPATPSATPVVSFPLPTIPPLSKDTTIPGEGEWKPIVSTEGAILLAKTTVQPDNDRPYATVNLVKMNMDKLQINIVAGLRQPGGPEKPGPGRVPMEIQNSNTLIAAFNGGFQQKDGYYGMIAGTTTYLPLKDALATLVMYKDAKPALIKYSGQKFDNTMLAVRQNCPMLIENSQIVTSSAAWDMQTWGLTTTNTMYTWRSGLGITKEGDIIYASGPSLIPDTLAKALQAAGAVNAMQLDINPVWVRFVTFNPLGKGEYQYAPLEPSMVNGGYEYLHGYQKDFFYVYKKS